ncbi:MAG: hypothetical protein GYB67_00825 [Chloroflexi bacterium]|nr:hypothetical protein [Chloroflexota bacterium]
MSFLKLERFFGGSAPARQQTSINEFYQTLLPEDVRYALSYRGARLGKSELFSLVHGYPHEVVYLLVKALAGTGEPQRQYLEAVTQLFSTPYQVDDLRALLQAYITALPDDVSITGTKLAQVSRAGSSRWQGQFRTLIENCYANDNHALPCIIAYTPMIAYQHFVDVYKQNPKVKLSLLVPEWMLDEENEQMGYEITLGDSPSVQVQTKSNCIYGQWTCMKTACAMQHRYCKTAIFIDDTIHTGKTANKLRSFWMSDYGLQIPDSRIRVLTDLREN